MPKIVKDEEVYHAVMQVVSERGYASATTRQMAEAANVSEVTLFRKYGSKHQLVKQATAAIIDQTHFDRAAQYTGDITSDLLRVVKAYQETAAQYGQFFMVLLVEAQRYPEGAELAVNPFVVYQDIAALLARYQNEGVLRQEHPLQALAALLGPIMIYVSLPRKMFPDASVPPLNIENHIANYLDGRRI